MTMWPPPGEPFPSGERGSVSDRDLQLAHAVARGMTAEVGLPHSRITIEVQNRIVLLSGTVDAPQTKELAGETARHVDGVRDVRNDIRVSRAADQSADAATSASGHDAFDQITERLFADIPPRGSSRHRTTKVAALLAALLTAALSVFMVRYGWIGVLIGCAVASVVLHIAHGQRSTSRNDRSPRAGHGHDGQ